MDATSSEPTEAAGAPPSPAEPKEPKPAAPGAINRARRLLEAGGRALDPNGPGGKDVVLAQRLLADAMIEAARGLLSEGATPDLAEAIAIFEARGDLAKAAGSADRARELAEALRITPPGDVEPAEIFVAKLVDAAAGVRSVRRSERVRRVVLVAAAAVAVLAIMVFEALRYPHYYYRFKASSTQGDFPIQGRLGETHEFGLIFHTAEENAPWVEIDLNATRSISQITIRHRTDCCTERGIPLIVEVAGEDKRWEEVAKREERFDKWTARFPEHQVRYVRLRSTAEKTVLHFSDVTFK